MNIKNAILESLKTKNLVKLTEKVKVSAIENKDITVRLFIDGTFIWTDSGKLENLVEDLENEINNFV